jgi:HlyD family secretion protein
MEGDQLMPPESLILVPPIHAERGAIADPIAADVRSLKRRLMAGVFISALLLFAIFGWAALAQLSGAVIASGTIIIDNASKKIQHPVGGVIGQILVKAGDSVRNGDVLVRLDDTQTRASLGIIRAQLVEFLARRARLAAERDNAERIEIPAELSAMGASAASVTAGEQRLFEALRLAMNGQKAQIGERLKQHEEEISGLQIQRDAKLHEQELIRSELGRITGLREQSLIPATRVLSMQREETRIHGEIGMLTAQIAKLRGQIAEGQLQLIALDQNRFSEAQKELRDADARIAELRERAVAAEDQLTRVDLKAPIAGVVHELNVHTVGGVISAGEDLMVIVPKDEFLIVEVRIPVSDIDQVWIGQRAVLRFPAFNQRTTPEVKGTVTLLSPDISHDRQTGQAYYTARITPAAGVGAQLQGSKLIPGMPAEVFIETASRSAISYLVKPMLDQLSRAFRER